MQGFDPIAAELARPAPVRQVGGDVYESNPLTRSPTRADAEEALDQLDILEVENGEHVAADGGLLAIGDLLGVIQPALLYGLPLVGMALVDLGEEYIIKNNFAATYNAGLYNSSTDSLGDGSDLSNVSTEPGGAAYARQATATTALDASGDWGVDNDSQESFDLSDTTSGSVDGWFWETSFQASDTGDGSSTPHLILFGSLSKSYDLNSVDTLNISAGSMQFTVS